MENKAIIVTDSINSNIVYADGSHPRCTTFDLTFWRALLAEFNTHQMIVKSSASSRAIPFKKMVAKVKETPFIPMRFQKDHSGMQGNEYLEGEEKEHAIHNWLVFKEVAIENATDFNDFNKVTKQLANRLLEPFMWHEVLCTATEYENFFALRASEFAEIHFADLAYKMLDAYNQSQPTELLGGEWHLPYGDQIDNRELYDITLGLNDGDFRFQRHFLYAQNEIKLKVSAARCARKSYKTLGDNPTIDLSKDIQLHDSLTNNGHYSPAAHPNRAMVESEYFAHNKTFVLDDISIDNYKENNARFIENGHTVISNKRVMGKYMVVEYGWCKQMRGFIPYRHLLPNENRTDKRVIRK